MSLTAVIILIGIGLLLVLVEFLVLPGANIPGLIGIIFILTGIYFGYNYFGTPKGHYILLGTFLLFLIAMVLALRSKTWKTLVLKSSISSKMENTDVQFVKPGDKGMAVTRLAPIGTVVVNEKSFEGKSGHKFIDPNTPVEVIKVNGNQLIVKPIE
ncbi:MAG: NfeD family protein [Salinivirgaceae bacterium]|nr:NfeD family protein [Salinivirgaceae bacterium]